MEDYKPNSHRFNAEQKKNAVAEKRVEKVVSGTAKTKKKNEVSKFKDVFISEDAANVKSYIVMDVLIPAAKKAISDIVSNGIDMILYGEKGSDRKKSRSCNYVSYRDYSDPRESRRTTARSRGFDFDDIIFETRGEAEAVREQMEEIIDRYGFVTVADLYDMADLTQPYTSNKYGWTSIRSAEPVRIHEGYILKLPKAMPID